MRSIVGIAVIVCAGPLLSQECSSSSNVSNFNGTPIHGGSYVWFNANFNAGGIPSTGAIITFQNSLITFTADRDYTLIVPNAEITFDPNAVCATTTFDTATSTWKTTVPVLGNGEIFLSGLAFPVPDSFALVTGRVQGQVTWSGEFSSSTTGLSVNWKWGAAVYKVFSTDYNAIAVKPSHQRSCQYNNSDHAGTPEGVDTGSGKPYKAFVTGGARGGGGSNWTGSWSSTVGTSVCEIQDLPE